MITVGPRNPSIQVERAGGPSAPSRAPIPGSPDGNVFRGGAAAPATDQAGRAPDPSEPQDGSPASEIDVLREAAAASAASRKAAAAERAARIRERDQELKAREARVDLIEKRLAAWRQPGGAALVLQDLEEGGIKFDDLAQAVVNGGTPELASLRAEIEELRNGVRETETRREAREVAERTAAQRQAETDAKAGYIEEVTGAVSAEQHPVLSHYAQRYPDRVGEYLFSTADAMFTNSGKVPSHAEVLDAVEQDLASDIEEAMTARSRGRGPAPAGSQPRGAPAGRAGETAADRRARFLGQLGGILKGIR